MPTSPHLRSLSDLGEFGLIKAIHQLFGKTSRSVAKGIGDDAAIIRIDAQRTLLITTDLLTEGIHFDLSYESLKDVGYRATVSSLSDIAAMGGTPQYGLVALSIPPSFTPTDVRTLYRGLMKPCQEFGVELIGGDTSASSSGLFLTVTVIGEGVKHNALRRDGAQVGDLLYLSGTIGDSCAGLHLLKTRVCKRPARKPNAIERFLIHRHLQPIARVHLGQALSRQGLATAAIDLSDGLSGDLYHLCLASRVGALLDLKALPLSSQLRTFSTGHQLDPFQLGLAGGEDYELAFTVSPHHRDKVRTLSKRLNLPLTCVGEMTPGSAGVRLKLPDGSHRKLFRRSFDHFAK